MSDVRCQVSTANRPLTPDNGQLATEHQAQPPIKPDRLLVGVIAGAALFYFIGRALGLGRRRGTHVEP